MLAGHDRGPQIRVPDIQGGGGKGVRVDSNFHREGEAVDGSYGRWNDSVCVGSGTRIGPISSALNAAERIINVLGLPRCSRPHGRVDPSAAERRE